MAGDIPKRSGTKDVLATVLDSTGLCHLKRISRRKEFLEARRFDKPVATLHRYVAD
jgi:hypothetical protein